MISARLSDGWRLALGTLTTIRTRPPGRIDREIAGAAMLLAPIAALPAALVVVAVSLAGVTLGAPALLTAVLVVSLLALSSRGLHLDGLADTADGLASGYDRERALSVMRRGDVGPVGVATLVLVLLAQVVCVAAMLDGGPTASAVLPGAAVLASRGMLTIPCATGILAARADGLGAAVAGSVPRLAAAGQVLGACVVTAAACWYARLPWFAGVIAVLAALVVVGALVARCVQRFGGITGDVLGAAIELSLATLLAGLALAG